MSVATLGRIELAKSAESVLSRSNFGQTFGIQIIHNCTSVVTGSLDAEMLLILYLVDQWRDIINISFELRLHPSDHPFYVCDINIGN